MRLLILLALAVLVPVATAQALQTPEPCGCDWRKLFERDPDLLVQPPEFQPVPISGDLFNRIPQLGSVPDAGNVSVVRFVVDTLGVTTDIRVECAPSEAASEHATALVERAVFSPARQRGHPVLLSMMLPVIVATENE